MDKELEQRLVKQAAKYRHNDDPATDIWWEGFSDWFDSLSPEEQKEVYDDYEAELALMEPEDNGDHDYMGQAL